MQLADVVRAYICARNTDRPIGRELAAKTCEHYYECAHVYGRYLRRTATTTDLRTGPVTAFLKHLLRDGASAYTVNNRRTGLLVQWRFAHAQGWATECKGVRPIHCPDLPVAGYDLAAMAQLLEYVASLRGVVRTTKVPKPLYWSSFLRTDWEVGMRIGDMIRVEVQHFDATGWLWCAETKTRKQGWRRLRPTTAESIAACIAANPARDRIWPGYTRKNICRAFSALAQSAGVGGTSKYIRSGSSSECDRLHPGTGWQHLRHSSPAVWKKHYKVDRIVERDKPLPPELPG